MVQPAYIHMPKTVYVDSPPPVIQDAEDTIVGCYYNVLYPLDEGREWEPKFDAWIWSRLAGGSDPFPLSDQILMDFPIKPTDASRPIEIYFAKKLKEKVEAGISLAEALPHALLTTQQNTKPVYMAIAKELQDCMERTQGTMSQRYNILAQSFIDACNVEKTTEWMLKELNDKGCSLELVDSFINVGSPSNYRKMMDLYRPMDTWKFRKEPVIQTLRSVQEYAGEAAHFFALQEVTPRIFVDLKAAFPTMQWFSVNTLTGDETKLISPSDEKFIGESSAFTVTLAVSSAWKVEKVAIQWLSNTPDIPSTTPGGSRQKRAILGVVATDPKSERKIALITTHADHFSMVPEVRKATSAAINQFIDKITENKTIAYIAGGDLNVFDNCDGQAYYDALIGDKGDYREKTLYAPKEIQKSTFLGLPADAYKAKIDDAGLVEPNALDHIFYSRELLELQFSARDAAVCDEKGQIIKPTDRAQYIEALKKRQTASDHFANILVVKPKQKA